MPDDEDDLAMERERTVIVGQMNSELKAIKGRSKAARKQRRLVYRRHRRRLARLDQSAGIDWENE